MPVDENALHPLGFTDTLVFLKPLAAGRDKVDVGRFSYYDDPVEPEKFFERNVLYHFEFTPSRLVIGSFCAFATGTTFLMDGANHPMGGLSTIPFDIFGDPWAEGFSSRDVTDEDRGDTAVGHDVWIGYGATIMPGVNIGAGAIIAAKSVVTRDVAPYSVVAGNPAREVRRRFDEDTVTRLLTAGWWDWPTDRIAAALPAIRSGDIDALEVQ